MSTTRTSIVLLLVAGLWGHASRADDPCATPASTISGSVTDAVGTPLAAARVRVQGCLGDPVVTDAAGNFTLAAPAGAQIVTASAPGYFNGCWNAGGDACAPVGTDASGLVIRLDPLPQSDDPAFVF